MTNQLRHSQVLFYMQIPTSEYYNTVVYDGMTNKEYIVKSFSHYEWGQGTDKAGVHIILQSEMEEYEEQGFDVEEFEACAVAFKKVTNE